MNNLLGVEGSSSKRPRKPYTITKSRESWTEEEHSKFLHALQLFDRDWKKIEEFVGSKTAIQVRSHAQKYFLKVQKNEHLAASMLLQVSVADPSVLSSPSAYTQSDDASRVLNNSSSAPFDTQGLPNFAEVYRFIGNIFDPAASGHLQKVMEMDPINIETVLLLVRNLTFNLSSPEFEHFRLQIHLSYKCYLEANRRPEDPSVYGLPIPSSVFPKSSNLLRPTISFGWCQYRMHFCTTLSKYQSTLIFSQRKFLPPSSYDVKDVRDAARDVIAN